MFWRYRRPINSHLWKYPPPNSNILNPSLYIFFFSKIESLTSPYQDLFQTGIFQCEFLGVLIAIIPMRTQPKLFLPSPDRGYSGICRQLLASDMITFLLPTFYTIFYPLLMGRRYVQGSVHSRMLAFVFQHSPLAGAPWWADRPRRILPCLSWV